MRKETLGGKGGTATKKAEWEEGKVNGVRIRQRGEREEGEG